MRLYYSNTDTENDNSGMIQQLFLLYRISLVGLGN